MNAQTMEVGRYELLFFVEEYYKAAGVKLSDPSYLGTVPVRIPIFDAKQSYHVPLCFSPWSIKRRGVKLGGYRAAAKLTARARRAGWEARVERANKKAADYARIIADIQATGITSLRGIAAALNERHVKTPRGDGDWQAVTVSRVLARLAVARDEATMTLDTNQRRCARAGSR